MNRLVGDPLAGRHSFRRKKWTSEDLEFEQKSVSLGDEDLPYSSTSREGNGLFVVRDLRTISSPRTFRVPFPSLRAFELVAKSRMDSV